MDPDGKGSVRFEPFFELFTKIPDSVTYGEEEIVIRSSGRVQGNLQAPRVTLENGSSFKGSIDMDADGQKGPAAAKPAPPPRPAGPAKLAPDPSKS